MTAVVTTPFREIKAGQTCDICGHDGRCKTDGSAILCFRVEEDRVNGYRRIKSTNGCTTYLPDREFKDFSRPATGDGPDLEAAVRRYEKAATNGKLERFANELGVSAESLRLLRAGINDRGELCFPECDADGKVIGICRRCGDGVKRVGKGQHRGLYIPRNLADLPDPVLIPEGGTDTGACLTMGLTAVGRPMASGGRWLLAKLLRGREVLIVADDDSAGHASAAAIAGHMSRACKRPVPWSVSPAKDVRRYLQQSAGDPRAVGEGLLAHLKAHIQQPEKTEPATTLNGGLTEFWLARKFVSQHGEDLHYSNTHGWLVWDGTHWVRDETGEVDQRVKMSVRSLYSEAAEIDDPVKRDALVDFARRCERHAKLTATIALARSEPSIPVRADMLDVDPFLFNVENGTLDLRSGELREHEREDLITKMSSVFYNPDATCPKWLKFLHMIMDDNEDLVAFLQRAAGYSLTGDTSERCLFVLWGTGCNGKSTFLETVMDMVGDYGLRTPTETLMRKRTGTIPNDVARLRGTRFVSASESEEGAQLAESFIKDLTGCDTLSARFMRQEFFDFRPQCKVWLATNHKPTIRGTDDAIWDRIRLVPFTTKIANPMPQREVKAMFQAELPGILAWAVKGCLLYLANGLQPPAEVIAAMKAYRSESDVVGTFLDECCTTGPETKVAAGDIYARFKQWLDENGEDAVSQKRLGASLTERGFRRDRYGPVRRHYWFGVGVMMNP